MRGIKGFLTRGLEAQGFERTKGYQEQTPADFVETAVAEYENTNAGLKAKCDAEKALARAQAVRQKPVQVEFERGEIDVTRSGQLKQGRLTNLRQAGSSWWSGVDVNQQKVNTETLESLRKYRSEAMRRKGKNEAEILAELSARRRTHFSADS